MNIAVGEKPAVLNLVVDKNIVDRAFNPGQIIGGELIRALKLNPAMIVEATSLIITVKVGHIVEAEEDTLFTPDDCPHADTDSTDGIWFCRDCGTTEHTR